MQSYESTDATSLKTQASMPVHHGLHHHALVHVHHVPRHGVALQVESLGCAGFSLGVLPSALYPEPGGRNPNLMNHLP